MKLLHQQKNQQEKKENNQSRTKKTQFEQKMCKEHIYGS